MVWERDKGPSRKRETPRRLYDERVIDRASAAAKGSILGLAAMSDIRTQGRVKPSVYWGARKELWGIKKGPHFPFSLPFVFSPTWSGSRILRSNPDVGEKTEEKRERDERKRETQPTAQRLVCVFFFHPTAALLNMYWPFDKGAAAEAQSNMLSSYRRQRPFLLGHRYAIFCLSYSWFFLWRKQKDEGREPGLAPTWERKPCEEKATRSMAAQR